jgi:hypothetical protein
MPSKHKVRFLGPFPNETIPSWISNIIYGCDRSVGEWIQLIQNYKSYALIFPFIQQHITILDTLIAHELRVRSLVQKFVRNIRMHIFARRMIGNVDLYTMSPIPSNSQVRIFDYKSKSLYLFHTQTAIRLIDSGLTHSNFGIAVPHVPRNPYTNLQFTQGQIISMITQIGFNCAHTHRFPPQRILKYRNCCYDIQLFKLQNKTTLNWEAAVQFLHSFHDPISVECYMEVLDDIIDIENLNVPRWNEVRLYIKNRTAPKELLKRFDSLVLSLFLFENHSLCYTFNSYTAMLDELETAYNALLQWKKSIMRRVGPLAFTRGSQNVLTS